MNRLPNPQPTPLEAEIADLFPKRLMRVVAGDEQLDRQELIEELIASYPEMKATRPPITRDDKPELYESLSEILTMGDATPRELIESFVPEGMIPAASRGSVAALVFAVLSIAEQVEALNTTPEDES